MRLGEANIAAGERASGVAITEGAAAARSCHVTAWTGLGGQQAGIITASVTAAV